MYKANPVRLIDALGGNAALRRMLTTHGISAPSAATVKQWKARVAIPETWLTTILVIAHESGAELDLLDVAEAVKPMTKGTEQPEHRSPGWDMRAIARVSKQHYGSIRAPFEAEGWQWAGAKWLSVANPKNIEKYGSIDQFVQAHHPNE